MQIQILLCALLCFACFPTDSNASSVLRKRSYELHSKLSPRQALQPRASKPEDDSSSKGKGEHGGKGGPGGKGEPGGKGYGVYTIPSDKSALLDFCNRGTDASVAGAPFLLFTSKKLDAMSQSKVYDFLSDTCDAYIAKTHPEYNKKTAPRFSGTKYATKMTLMDGGVLPVIGFPTVYAATCDPIDITSVDFWTKKLTGEQTAALTKHPFPSSTLDWLNAEIGDDIDAPKSLDENLCSHVHF